MARTLNALELGRLFYSVGQLRDPLGWTTRRQLEANRFKLEILAATDIELYDIEHYLMGFVFLLVLARLHPLRPGKRNHCMFKGGHLAYNTRSLGWLHLCFDCDRWVLDRMIYPDGE